MVFNRSNLKFSYHTKNIYAQDSFSISGEDIFVFDFFRNLNNGFYLDLGAHHPFRFSTTYKLYKKGWRGINIDGIQESIDLFNKYRPRDNNICQILSDKVQDVVFYKTKLGAMNTISKKTAESNPEKYINEVQVRAETISNILNTVLRSEQKIDYLNVDLEGIDFKIISSFPFEVWTPKLISIEDNNFTFENMVGNQIVKYLEGFGYSLITVIKKTLFFSFKDD